MSDIIKRLPLNGNLILHHLYGLFSKIVHFLVFWAIYVQKMFLSISIYLSRPITKDLKISLPSNQNCNTYEKKNPQNLPFFWNSKNYRYASNALQSAASYFHYFRHFSQNFTCKSHVLKVAISGEHFMKYRKIQNRSLGLVDIFKHISGSLYLGSFY